MKKLLIAPLLMLSLISSATVYYIDPSGKNTNNGSLSSPWNTLSYACSKVTAAGDIIHVNAGTYNETAQSVLAPGVSIEGAGTTSVIHSQVGGTSYTILLSSGSEAANGNQHISNIYMDGNSYGAYGAILVAHRKNVEIYNCTIVNFNYYGVSFTNGEPPSVYATGNKFYNNIVTNCGGYFSGNRASLEIQGQDGMVINGNTITIERPDGKNGDCIYGVEGFLKNVKIYNNTFSKKFIPGTTNWDFALELWNCLGGVEIYDNKITGSIDLDICSKGASSYSVWLHNNSIGQQSLMASQVTHGVLLEFEQSDIIIEKNYIHDVAQGIMFQQSRPINFNNCRISYNVLNNIGSNLNSTGWGIYFSPEDNNDIYTGIQISNNVIVAASNTYSTIAGIYLYGLWQGHNVSIRNNIIVGFDQAPVWGSGAAGQTINGLAIDHNNFFGNGNSDNVQFVSGLSPTNYTFDTPIKSDPLFVSSSDFHLQAASLAIGKGIKIAGLSTDYAGNTLNDPPSIGVYESGFAVAVSAVPVYQNSVIENSAPATLVMTYNLSLASIAPSSAAFAVQVNSVPRAVSVIAISGMKVLLTLASPVVKGDIVKVAYTKPSTNQLQTSTGGQAVSLTAQTVTNNVTTVATVATDSKVVLTINPNPVHRILNAVVTYTSPLTGDQASSLQILRIFDVSGMLLIEKLLSKSTVNIRMPINLRPGIYVVQLMISGLEMATQKIIVY
jgi:uncharacterized repeat protein (TIGR02059 family)